MRLNLTLLIALGVLPVISAFAQTGTVEGRMVVNGKEHVMKYVHAANVPSDTDKGKTELLVLLSDEPVPLKDLFDEGLLFEASSKGQVHGLEFRFADGGIRWSIWTKDAKGVSVNHWQSPNPYPFKLSDGVVQGEVSDKSTRDDISLDIAVKFNAPIEKFVPAPEPTAADRLAARSSAAAKAYLDFEDAITKGDRARIRASAPPEFVAQIDGPDFEKMLPVAQAMQNKDLVVLKAVEKDGEATLLVSGKSPEGTAQRGEVTMTFTANKWILKSESWKIAR